MGMNPIALLSMLGMLNQRPGTGNGLSQGTDQGPMPTSPEEALSGVGVRPMPASGAPSGAPSTPSPMGGGSQDLPFAMRFMLGQEIGRAMNGGGGGMGSLGTASIMRMMMEQRQRQQQNAAMGQGVQGVQEALAKGDIEGAAGITAQLAATGMLSENGAKSLNTLIDRARVRQQGIESQKALVGAVQAYRQGGPDAVLGDPNLVQSLSTYPGGVHGFLAEMTPKTEIKEGLRVTTPSVFTGGQPTVAGLPQAPKLDSETTKLLAERFHLDENDVKQGYLNGDPTIKGAVLAAQTLARSEGAAGRLGIEKDVASAINALPPQVLAQGGFKNSLDVLSAREGGSPQQQAAAQQVIAAGQHMVDQRKINVAVAEAQAKALATRNVTANDPFKMAGQEFYDQKTGQPVMLTQAQSRDPRIWAANGQGGTVVPVTAGEATQMRFMDSEVTPEIDAARKLANKILGTAKVLNVPAGVLLNAKGYTGNADVKQFKEEMRKLNVATARIEGGSVRIPVTMLKMFDEVAPTTTSTVEQANRLLDSLQASAENRRRSWLKRPDLVPIPTGAETPAAGPGGPWKKAK